VLRWALLLLAGCDGVFGIQHISILDAAVDAPPEAPVGYAAAVVADHPVAFLPLDETAGLVAHDLVGGHDGQIKGTGIELGVEPPFPSMRHAMSIDGVDGAVDLGDQFGFAGTAPYTLEVWVSPRVASRTFYTIISKWREPGTNPPAGWNLFYDNSSNIAYTREAEAEPTQPRANAEFLPGWHHVAATYDGTMMELYYDGSDADSVATTFGLDVISQHLEIGAGNGDPAAVTLFGSICQVAIYDYALTPTQINAHYNARSL
jgi:concanavalin A-like lectin/glucanase superfamily protein